MVCSRVTLVATIVSALLLCGDLVLQCHAAKRAPRRRRQLLALEGPCDEPIWDSGLMEKMVPFATLVEKGGQYDELATNPEARRFDGTVLGYITPWNPSGYQNALTWRHKLTHVAPVWYQLRASKGADGKGPIFGLSGGHEYNATWVKELQQPGAGRVPKLVPRVIIELSPDDMVALLQGPEAGMNQVLAEVEAKGYDGIVLEVWQSWLSMNGLSNDDFRKAATALVMGMGEALTGKGKELIMAIPPVFPSSPKGAYSERDLVGALLPHVSAWSVMTYDFSASQDPGPNAPIKWLQQNIDFATTGMVEGATLKDGMVPAEVWPEGSAAKLLMGLNFYGYDYDMTKKGLQAVTWPNTIKLLRTHEPQLVWDDNVAEHAFVYEDAAGSTHEVWFPTPRSLYTRLEAARKAGTGISIWELGQGMARFMELL